MHLEMMNHSVKCFESEGLKLIELLLSEIEVQIFTVSAEYSMREKEKDCAFVIVTFPVQLISRIQRWSCYCMFRVRNPIKDFILNQQRDTF